ncbi:MAG TPA: 6-bladed beta-propeller [Gemmatimonadales bacterium]|jgi:hypothetical protein
MHRTTALVTTVIVVAGHHLGAQSRLSKPVIDTVNHHIVRVTNSGPSAWADTNGWKLVLERTVQPADGAPGMLEDPDDIILMNDGRLIIGQRHPASVRLYDREGTFVRTIGRAGDGPGEYRAPNIAVFHDTLVTYDGAIGRASLFTVDGKFVRTFLTNVHDDGPPIAIDSRGRLRIEQDRAGGGFKKDWIFFNLTGKRLDSVAVPQATHVLTWDVQIPGGSMSRGVPNTPRNIVATFGDGSFAVGGSDHYAFTHVGPHGDTTRIFARSSITAERISSAHRDSLFAPIARVQALRGVATARDIPSELPVMTDAVTDPLGNLWVMTGPTRNGRLDVYNPAGNYLGAVASPLKMFALTSWTADHVAVYNTDANDLPRIQIYRIDRRGK